MKFKNKKLGEGMVKGNIKDMELTHGKIPLKDILFHWKKAQAAGNMRYGHNKEEDAFFIQIFSKKENYGFRIWLTSDEYQGICAALLGTWKASISDRGV